MALQLLPSVPFVQHESRIAVSVLIAFTVGGIIQWITRFLMTFNFEDKNKWYGAIFSGIALTAITYFIFIITIKFLEIAITNL